MRRARQTKIVATLGPATDSPETIARLVEAGMDCARVNCSYGDASEWRRVVGEVRSAAAAAGRWTAVMFDVQGAKLRLAEGLAAADLVRDARVEVCGPEGCLTASDGSVVRLSDQHHVELLDEGSEIVIGDGTPRLVVERIGPGSATAVVVEPGRIAARKGVTVINSQPVVQPMSAKDARDLDAAAALGADFVAISYVRDADDVHRVRDRLAAAGSRARVIAKLERIEAYENLDAIVAAADGIMVARGDLGVAVGIERVPLIQKKMIRRGNQGGKLVITATQMLESMIIAPLPTRAEVADVANAVVDGTSAVMLSAETSVGAYPVEAVKQMAAIAAAAEGEQIQGAVGDAEAEQRDAAVMHAALYLSHVTRAGALIVPTSSGNTVRACNKYRPLTPIVAITDDPVVARQLSLEWGTEPTLMERIESTDAFVDAAIAHVKRLIGLQSGQPVVVTAGRMAGRSGATDLIVLREVE